MNSRPERGVVRQRMWAAEYVAAEEREKNEKKPPTPPPRPESEPAKAPPPAERVGPGSKIDRFSHKPGPKGVRKPPPLPAPDPIKPPD